MEKLNFEIIQSYQSFSTIAEMDQAVRGFLYKHKSALSEGTMKVLKFIWRHSVKVIGVSFAKYDTIAAEVQISRRTVIRATKQLESLGIIKKIPTARMNGKQGVNLLVIQPFQSIEEVKNNMSLQDVTAPVTPNKTKNKQSSLCEIKNKPTYVREYGKGIILSFRIYSKGNIRLHSRSSTRYKFSTRICHKIVQQQSRF